MTRLTVTLAHLTLGLTLCLLPACSNPARQAERAQQSAEDTKSLNDWFEARFEEQLARSPIEQTYLGMKGGQDKLNDVSQLALDEEAALFDAWAKEMRRTFDPDHLDHTGKLSYRLFEYDAEDQASEHRNSPLKYVFDPMSGAHTNLPAFLINFHKVDSVDDARAYISRLKAIDTYMGQLEARTEAQAEGGVLLPRFAYEQLISASQNVISGAPFEEGDDSPLFSDVQSKIKALALAPDEEVKLIEEGRQALITSVKPAYERLIDMFTRHGELATDDDGVWKLPGGSLFYQHQLKHFTTTDMTADEIHEIGLKEVARIQGEMKAVLEQVGFEGTLQEFFTYLRTDTDFTFPNTDAGRAEYIEKATAIIDTMKARQSDLFLTQPKADIIVKRVELFREDTAYGAFYEQPSLDGTRPGTYYINLKDMSELPIYQMQALAYHEGTPGHHMQISLAQELPDLPKFRALGSHTAYVEGWALYAEGLPKELGLYTDPYQIFGQLSMEIFRAARLVVDTGIHQKRWTRQQAVEYMMKNTANSEGDIRAEVDRYIVWPGQATAYKIGMIKIDNLRQNAKLRLGDRFDIREFHDVILGNGSVPLSILEDEIETWIENHD